MSNPLKNLVLTVLPAPLLQRARKFHYLRSIMSAGFTDEPDLTVVERLARPGDTVLDIGANFGLYTRFLSEFVGPEGRVLAVEPVPETFAILRYIQEKKRWANVSLFNVAATDFDGPVEMEIPRLPRGGENLYQSRIVTGAGAGELRRVATLGRRLDSLFADAGGPVTFVKCDVEGHELSCLRGAEALVRRWQPALLLEVSGDPAPAGGGLSPVFAFLAERGYEAYWFDGHGLIRRSSRSPRPNSFFLKEGHLDRLRASSISVLPG